MAQVTFRIFFRRSIHSKADGARFWGSFIRHFPNHVPTGMGHGLNPTAVFDPDDMESVLRKWNRRNLYFEGAPRLSLAGQIVRPRPGSDHEPPPYTEVFVYAFEDDPQAVRGFLYEISTAFEADYATAHILTKEQRRRTLQQRAEAAWLKSPTLGKRIEAGLQKQLDSWPNRTALGPELPGINLRRGYIRELNWLTILGLPYVEFFGRERILATPAQEIQELPYGGIGIQLTRTIEDIEGPEAWDQFLAARATAKSHLDKNAFFNSTLPAAHAYDGPILTCPEYK